MQFIHTHQQVQAGIKTKTRRTKFPYEIWRALHKQGWSVTKTQWESGAIHPLDIQEANRILQAVQITVPVIPAYRAKAIAQIHIKSIQWDKDVREISEEEAKAEGFVDAGYFWETWVSRHDKKFHKTFVYAWDCDQLDEYEFFDRPIERYQAWVIEFERVVANV